MIKFKDVLNALNLDLEFDEILLNMPLNIDRLFDNYKYDEEGKFYKCTYDDDPTHFLRIYPTDIDGDDIALEVLYSPTENSPVVGVGYNFGGLLIRMY